MGDVSCWPKPLPLCTPFSPPVSLQWLPAIKKPCLLRARLAVANAYLFFSAQNQRCAITAPFLPSHLLYLSSHQTRLFSVAKRWHHNHSALFLFPHELAGWHSPPNPLLHGANPQLF